MERIYLQKSTEKLSLSGGQLIHSEEGKELNRYPICMTEQVAVYGNGQITTQALKECLKEGVAVNYFNKYGIFLGRVEPDYPKNVRRRLEQYRLYLDTGRKNRWIRELLKGKLQGELVEIRRLREQGYELKEREIRRVLREGKKGLEKASAPGEMLGIEGNCARKYYEIFPCVLPHGAAWAGRRSHPAGDKVNALLSYVYVMTAQRIREELENRSLDVHCGFLHEPGYGGAGLEYDLLELFRATWCDHHAIRLMNHVKEVRTYVTGTGGEPRLPEEVRERIAEELHEKEGLVHGKHGRRFSDLLSEAADETIRCLKNDMENPGYVKLHPER